VERAGGAPLGVRARAAALGLLQLLDHVTSIVRPG
jgi:hypothetical protein